MQTFQDNVAQWHYHGDASWYGGATLIREPAPWVPLYCGASIIGSAQQYTAEDGKQRIRYDVVDKDEEARLLAGLLDDFSLGGFPITFGSI